MAIVKDLLYEKNNEHLDIARLSAFIGVLGYSAMSAYYIAIGGLFDPFAWGGGWAALCGGNAAWIYARQRYEARIAFSPTERNADNSYGSGGYGGDYMYDRPRSPRTYDDVP